jgi:hypothetical protein
MAISRPNGGPALRARHRAGGADLCRHVLAWLEVLIPLLRFSKNVLESKATTALAFRIVFEKTAAPRLTALNIIICYITNIYKA